MTKHAIPDPAVIEQYAGHARAIIDGRLATPRRAVLIEFYDGDDASVIFYGISHEAGASENLSLALAAMNVLAGAARELNADASN